MRNECLLLEQDTSAASLTGVSVHVQVPRTSEGKPKAGRDAPSGPLAPDHLRGLFAEPFRASVVDVHQPTLLLPSERTADRHICSEREVKSKTLLGESHPVPPLKILLLTIVAIQVEVSQRGDVAAVPPVDLGSR